MFACYIMISPYGPLVCGLTLYVTVSGGDNYSKYRLFYRSERAVLVMVLQRFTLINSLHDKSHAC